MKRFAFLTLMMFSIVVSGWSQGTASYFTLCDDAQSSSVKMTVKAILDLSNTSIYWGDYGRYQVAAFIEGECHSIAMEGQSDNVSYWLSKGGGREDYSNWFVLKIPYSSARSGKSITFKMYNNNTGLEYTLKNDDGIRSIGINMGSDENPIVLKAVEMTDMAFNNFEMKVNSMQDLSSKLTLSPSGATCPNNLEFDISPSTYTLNLTGDGGYQFRPSATGTYDVMGYAGNLGIRFRDGEITVAKQPNYVSGLSINSGYETLDVIKGDADMLGDELARALNVSYFYPGESPDEYPVWESSNTSIVGPDATGKLIPKKSGTCTLTAKVFNTPGNASSGVRKSASLTVNVHQYVTDITMNYTSLDCIIGDDLTDYLPRTFTIQPSDADNKTVAYTILRGDGILQKRSDGHIVAIGKGTATIQISSSDPGTPSGSLSVIVNNIYNDISIKQSSLNIKYNGAGSAQDITDAVTANYSYLPDGGFFMGEFPTVTSNNPSVVKVVQEQTATGVGSGITVTALGTGTATITVTMKVPNLIELSLGNYSAAPTSVTKSFTVVMAQGAPSAISLPWAIEVKYGETLDLRSKITLTPSNAEFDYTKLVWSCSESNWTDFFTITNNVLTTKKPSRNSFHLTASVTGSTLTATTVVTIPNPATGLTVKSGYETITVFTDGHTELNQKLKAAFVVTPENTTDYIEYVIADQTVISEERDEFFIENPGTTTVTCRVYNYVNSEKKVLFEKSVTVIVKVKLNSFSFKAREYSLNVNQTLDLKKELELSPANADIDMSQIVWAVEDNTKAKVENGVLTALAPTAPGYFEVTATLGSIKASTILYIYQPATAIKVNSGYETIEVYVGERQKLTDALRKAVTILPANTTDPYYWEIADNTIVTYDDMSDTFTPAKGGTTKATAIVKGNDNLKAELTIKVLVKTEGLAFIGRDYDMNVGETKDFTDELEIYPADAELDKSKIVLSVDEGSKDKVRIEGLKVTALQPAYPDAVELTATLAGTDLKATTEFWIYSPITAITVNSGYETINVYVGEGDKLTEQLKSAITIEPANTTDYTLWEFADKSIVTYDADKNQYVPLKVGTTKATAMAYRDRSKKAELTIVVLDKTTNVTSITINGPATLAVGSAATFTVKPNTGATLVASSLKVTETSGTSWPLIQVDNIKQNGDGSATVTVMPQVPGKDRINVAYNSLTANKEVTIGVPTTLKQGWQWMTLYSDTEKDPSKVFGANIHEVRSQTDLLAYEDGEYYGTLTIEAGKAYMVRAAKNVAADKAFLQTDGKLVTKSEPLNLYAGWTWMAYPYVHAYAPNDLKLKPSDGDRIVSKTNGFVEYDNGAWTGTLSKLNPYEAYLYYNHKGEATSLTWQPEATLYKDSKPSTSRAQTTERLLSSDASLYRTNMTMVATLNSQLSALSSQLIIGAFVGSECRGEGQLVNGLFFITVHANDGERVTFRLIDTDSDIEYNINETVTVTRMLGTVQQPYQFTVDTQGIMSSSIPSTGEEIESYDLLGRKVSAQSPSYGGVRGGILLQRQANGQVKKVVVRNK